MKLLRLKLDTQFRSLQAGFEVYFLRDFDKAKLWHFAPYCLVGRNGSGKSNILEALAAIFYHIECIYLDFKPDGFEGEGNFNQVRTDGFFPENCYPDAFELEYRIPVKNKLSAASEELVNHPETAHILIIKKARRTPVIKCLNKEVLEGADFYRNNNQEAAESDELSRLGVKEVLPEFVVGYSSGENEILSLPFFKMRFIHFDEYEARKHDEQGYNNQPEGRLVYIDTNYSQAVMLTNFLMQAEDILRPIYDTIGVKAIRQFRIIINEKLQRTQSTIIQVDGEQVYREDQKNETEDWTSLLKQKDPDSRDLKVIDKLKSCATCRYYDRVNHSWYLDYYIDEDKRDEFGSIRKDENGELIGLSEMKKAFRTHFNNNPFELFRAFQILLTLNLYDVDPETKIELYRSGSLYVNETVPVPASHRRVMRFKDFSIEKEKPTDNILSKSLSDGEHQYLHTIGICLLFRNTNSLFLLDEPETHFNPDWRATFISTLKNSLQTEKNEEKLREFLITSHSPFIISDSQEENVLVFRKDPETGEVDAQRPGFNTFGASVNQITIKIFEKSETIGDYAKTSLDNLYQRLETDENPDELIEEANRRFGDSVEKILFVNKANEKKS